ncbi:MAG: N-acyl homoserine lactonase family protein [Clostridiales Family XIII bacterium]|nr:N-acyl homoserine lactonase family protein [Clostridiales Family XIII bacterium]
MSEMKVYCMKNGLNVDSLKSDLIYTDDPTETFNFPSWTVLIRHPEANILFDAAAHKIPERQMVLVLENLKMKKEDEPPARLRQIGLEPEDINLVVLSHMHCDHIGYIDAFPNAKILVSEAEFLYTMRDYGMYKSGVQKDLKYFIEKRPNWELIPGDFETKELVPGVTIYNFGRGHSYGMIGLMLDLPNSGKKFLVGDAIYAAESIGPPLRKPGICLDMENWLRTVRYIQKVAAEENAEIWYGHDLDQFNSLVKSSEGYYD